MLVKLRQWVSIVISSLVLSVLAYFLWSALLGNYGLWGSNTNSYTAAAAAAPKPQGTAEQQAFLADRAVEADYDSLSPAAQATWDTVANTLYTKIGAYDLRFQLTDNHLMNCSINSPSARGGCYHTGGNYDRMIFISPEGINEDALDYITYHEYSHHLQHMEGGTRFSPDTECDADLRALDLRGSFAPGFEHQCLAFGMDASELTLKNLPNLEAQLIQSR